jgi:LacI family transcriptional regulator
MKRSTLLDISKKTGLSVTTISRVLNGKSEEYRISKASQDVVLKAVKELNYNPNIIAQSLRNNATHTIGLLVPCIENPFFANIASVVIREAHKYMYPVMVIDTRESTVDEDRAIETLLARNVDGIIMAPTGDNPTRLVQINQQKPIMLIDRYYKDYDLPYVATDNYSGAHDAVKQLIANGHKDILCIQGSQTSITSQERVRGYNDALEEAGLEDNIYVCGNEFSTQNGYVETKLAICSGLKFSAIFALSSTILLGAFKALSESNLHVPDDISIISFDDNVYLDYLNPPITRVSQPVEHIGIVAVKMLMDRIMNQGASFQSILLQPTIIQRSSIKRLL